MKSPLIERVLKKLLITILLTFFLLPASPAPLCGSSPEPSVIINSRLWEKAERAAEDGLPVTAAAYLEEIIQLNLREKNYPEWMKALTWKISLETAVEGGLPEERIYRLIQALEESPAETHSLLKAVLARWYRQFFESNRWRFAQRSAVEGVDEDDIRTWNLRRILDEIDGIYTDILENKEALLDIPSKNYAAFLSAGNTSPNHRPTLYDFLSFEALDFYRFADIHTPGYDGAFSIDFESAASGRLKKFLRYKPDTEDTVSYKYRAVMLFQELLRFHRKSDNRAARADTDLERILFIKNNSIGENKEEVYFRRLEEIVKYSDCDEVNAYLYFLMARSLGHQDEPDKAVETARKGFLLYPHTPGGDACENYVAHMERRSIRIVSENLIPEGETGRLNISRRNLQSVHFRVYRDVWDGFLGSRNLPPSMLEEPEEMLGGTPDYSWKFRLGDVSPYSVVESTVSMPQMEAGFYRIFASPDGEFKEYSQSWFWVSPMGIVSRHRNEKAEGYILNNITGEPVAGAAVTCYAEKRGEGYAEYDRILAGDDGFFRFEMDDKDYFRRAFVIHASSGGNEMLLSSGWNQAGEAFRERRAEIRLMLLTDRALYRPGQNIHFKVIAVAAVHGHEEYSVYPGLFPLSLTTALGMEPIPSLIVTLYDANGKQCGSLDLVLNDFGSASGSFTIPDNVLKGRMTISARLLHIPLFVVGRANLRVEEYKRPKFRVIIDKPEDETRIGETDRKRLPGI